jgi:holliday junction DNA helicase RuvB
MMRTARGRMATRQAYLHFGLPAPARALDPETLSLFEQDAREQD